MDCPICFEITDEINLSCGHKIHKDCLRNLLKSNAPKKCPMCRTYLDLEKYNEIHNFNRCHLCNDKIDLESLNFVKNVACGCIFHYDCFNKKLKESGITDCRKYINCPSCRTQTDRYFLEAYSYLYFYDGMVRWVGEPPRCRYIDQGERCYNEASPKKYYFCREHYYMERTNYSFYKGLKYIFKYASSLEETERMKIFCRIVEMWDVNEKNIKFLSYDKWSEII